MLMLYDFMLHYYDIALLFDMVLFSCCFVRYLTTRFCTISMLHYVMLHYLMLHYFDTTLSEVSLFNVVLS